MIGLVSRREMDRAKANDLLLGGIERAAHDLHHMLLAHTFSLGMIVE